MAEVILTDSNFESEVLKSDKPVLVDFWAVWCGPCQVLGPIVEELSHEYEGKIKVGKMDVDQNPQSASTFGIMSIPTVMIFKGGNVVKQLIGLQSKETLKAELDRVI
jgi:thioredoxin 1